MVPRALSIAIAAAAVGLAGAALLAGARHRWDARTAELIARLSDSVASAGTAPAAADPSTVAPAAAAASAAAPPAAAASAAAPSAAAASAAALAEGAPAEAATAPQALPPPVARYLESVSAGGVDADTRSPARVRLRWRGEFNLGSPGADRWVPFAATQDFVPAAPGFVWDARLRMAPGLDVRVRDALVGGEASMLGKVLALVTVVDSHGTPALAAGALQRYLGEAAWFPFALRPAAGVRWEPIDDTRARATVRAPGPSGPVTASLEFRFGPGGLPASVYTPARLFDNGRDPPVMRPWQARYLRHGRVGGRLVPVEAVVEWLLPGGAWAVWRGRPESIEVVPIVSSRVGGRG